MYNPFKTIKEIYNGYDTGTGGAFGVFAGGVLGGIAGVAVPSIVGWEVGDYVQRAMEFGVIAAVATKLSGAALATAAIGNVTVPLGILGGAAFGGAAGAGIGLAKEGLEGLLKRKDEEDKGE